MRASIHMCLIYLVGGIVASSLERIQSDETHKEDVRSKQMVSSYQIRIWQQNKHAVKEWVIINNKAQTETFVIPRYGQNTAAVIIDDFSKNVTLIRDKEKNICYFTRENFMDETPRVLKEIIDREIHLRKALRSNDQIENKETSTWQIGKQLTHSDRCRFDKNMMKLCGNRPVFWLKKIMENQGKRPNYGVGKRECYTTICTTYYHTVYYFYPRYHTVKVKRTKCLTVYC